MGKEVATLNGTNAMRTPLIVVDETGLQGVIDEEQQLPPSLDHHLLVHFDNGQAAYVPREMLTLHQDGRYYLPVGIEALLAEQAGSERRHASQDAPEVLTQEIAEDQSLVIPVIEEKLNVRKQVREIGVVEVRKTIHERTETVDLPLQAEQVEVERIAVNRFVDGPVPVRHEGDTMIISLLEEVAVVEKRLLLREEVHVKTVRKEVHNPQAVTLREERVDVVRKPGPGQDGQQAEAQ